MRTSDDEIILFLRSGPKRSSELVELLKGELSRPTVFRRLCTLRKRGIIRRERGEEGVYYSLPKIEKIVLPPYVVAPKRLIDKCLSQLEKSLEFGKYVALKHAKKYQKLEGFVKYSEVIKDRGKRENLLESIARGDEKTVRSIYKLLLTEAVVEFGELCIKYRGITYDQRSFKRIFEILDRSDSFHDDSLNIIISTFYRLVYNAFDEKESAKVILAIKDRIGLLEELCIRRPKVGFWVLNLIWTVSKKEARKTLLKMIESGQYSSEKLVEQTLRLYMGDLDKLKTDIEAHFKKSDPKTKARIKKFLSNIQETLFRAGEN